VFRDTLINRLKSINQVRTDFEKRVKETEQSVEHRMTYVHLSVLSSEADEKITQEATGAEMAGT
jgi:hypothetical protein